MAFDDIAKTAGLAQALNRFIATEWGQFTVDAYHRIVPLLAEAESRDDRLYGAGDLPGGVLPEHAERQLRGTVALLMIDLKKQIAKADWDAALDCLVSPCLMAEKMIDGLMVNDPDPAVRLRRLGLLAGVRIMVMSVADLSRLQSGPPSQGDLARLDRPAPDPAVDLQEAENTRIAREIAPEWPMSAEDGPDEPLR